MQKILTIPKEIDQNMKVLYTGNHYISLPEINVQDAATKSLNIISTTNKGLVELKGEKHLFQPHFFRNGEKLSIKHVSAKMESFMFPAFHFEFTDNTWINVFIYPDLKEKGFIYEFSSSERTDIEFIFQPDILSFLRFNSHEIEFTKQLKIDKWLGNPVLDIRANQVSFSMAFGASTEFTFETNYKEHLSLSLTCSNEAAIYVSLNSDPDGASTNLIHLKRKEYHNIKSEFVQWINDKKVSFEKDAYIEDRLNQNLFFNYFFAIGKDLDQDKFIAMTSRSPRYYVSGAFWERDSFLWSFPALKIVDYHFYKKVAKEHIIRHSKNAGDHAHYIDGTVLYPGFELDEAASYFILLNDFDAEEIDPEFLNAIEEVLHRIEMERDSKTGLYRTFLMPSDDPSEYPFVTINQAILLKGFLNLSELYLKLNRPEKVVWLEGRRKAIQLGIENHLVKEVNGKKMYVWSADGEGNYLLYNDPPGNIGLLPFYGLNSEGDSCFTNTIDYYYSSQYHYYDRNAEIKELACDHHPQTPSGLGLCGSILNPLMKEQAIDWLRKAEMDFGLLAESFDKNTGEAKTGVGFATGCGYLAYALYEVLVKDEAK